MFSKINKCAVFPAHDGVRITFQAKHKHDTQTLELFEAAE